MEMARSSKWGGSEKDLGRDDEKHWGRDRLGKKEMNCHINGVEKKYGKSKFKDNKNAFRKACREYASKQIIKQKSDFIRLGVSADWENFYTSMDKSFESSVIRSLSNILSNNHIYFGSKPV